ncbi:MAG: hypothetical protein AABO41_18040 [Acidobacteriota bacterium]
MRRSILSSAVMALIIASVLVTSLVGSQAAQQTGQVSYIPYAEAKPILEAVNDVLPAELRSAKPESMPTIWASWVAHRDSEIRGRLAQGDEDSLINFVLFGTSFTRNPRITLNVLAQMAGKQSKEPSGSLSTAEVFFKAVDSRVDDLVRAMTGPGSNERVIFARRMIEKKGYDLRTAAGRDRIRTYLLANLSRMLNEQAGYARLLQSARLLGDPSAEFAERSKLYSGRGLSSDTSLLPNYALEKALISIKARGLLAPGTVRRVAIVGPGLDFTDKEDGYDFYPQQTIQPFAIIDTLLRTMLSRASDLKVTTLDLSPRVNDHLRGARQRAGRGEAYTIQLPRDALRPWYPDAIDYWLRFGEHIGKPVAPVALPPGIGDLKIRAVRVRPSIVSSVTPEDANIVVQRLNVAEGFDLIIATNILVYYDVFEQSLALANVERMLRPGGLLLSNNALLELPNSEMRSVGYETVVYSERPDHGDHIVWYQRRASR